MLKILLIDDDDDLLEMTERRLRKKGFEVTAVSSLADARRAWDGVPKAAFGAVVCDLFLRNENGLTFFEQLRSDGFHGTFVLATGDADGDPRIGAHVSGSPGFHCLQKPYPMENLVEILAQAQPRSA